MAKNSQIYSANNPYGNRDEEIRKAKGNPNKNIHAKKKNSNYGGYNGAAEKAHKAAEEKSTLNKLPTWMKVTLIVDIVVIVVLLILRLGVLKNNAPLSYITTLFLGLTCAFLAYMRNYQYKEKVDRLQDSAGHSDSDGHPLYLHGCHGHLHPVPLKRCPDPTGRKEGSAWVCTTGTASA